MNAIITAATGYKEADLQIFLDSVKRNCSNTKVFLISFRQDRETIKNLQIKYPFIEAIYIRKRSYKEMKIAYSLAGFLNINAKDYSSLNSFLKFIVRAQLHIMNERFFIALKILKSFEGFFSNILLTDSRDVVIQSDPFSLIDKNLISGIEPVNIGDDPDYNATWIRYIYGDEVLNNLLNKQMVCSGVTLGPTSKVEKYLMEMCGEICRHLQAFNSLFDQAIHNYLIYYNKVMPELVDNQSGLIATLCLEDRSNITIDSRTGSVKVHGKYPAIIHQYDRHPDLLEFFKKSVTTASV